MRQFSTKSTMNQLKSTSTSEAPEVIHFSASIVVPSISASFNDPDRLARTRNPRNNAGSARQAKVTSRAAPMPSNGEPVSSAAQAVKNRPNPSKYAKSNTSPVNEIGALGPTRGISNPASATVANPTTGPARKIQVVVVLITEPLRKSLTKSKYGWSSGGPTRPANNALVLLMTPNNSGGNVKTARI